MKKTDLEKWALEVFWSAYKGLVKTPFGTEYGAGARGECIQKILSMNPSETMRHTLITAISEQMNHRRKLYEKSGSREAYNRKTAKIKFYCNRGGKTWLNQRGFDDEIPSLTDEKVYHTQEPSNEACKTEGCNNKAIGGMFGVCQSCECKTHDVYREEKRSYLKKVGLTMSDGETLKSYADRCKQHTFEIMKVMKKSPNTLIG